MPSAQVEQSGEKVAKDAGEDVDMEFLIRPMELGTQRDMDGVFEVCKRQPPHSLVLGRRD